MRVVIDTNIFISSFFGGKPRKIIDLWKEGKIYLCLSSEILDEYIDVLQRFLGKNSKEISELLALFSKGTNILFTRNPPAINVVKKDPDDNKFIACALKLKADYIITGDSALKEIKTFSNIKILSPSHFLENFNKSRKTL